jgi:WD40 repeat protein
MFDPDGQLISVSHLNPGVLEIPAPYLHVKCWELEQGQEVRGFTVARRSILPTLSADGRRLVVADSDSITLVDVPTGREQVLVPNLRTSIGILRTSADGRVLAWAPALPNAVHVWDVAAAAGPVLPVGGVRCFAFSPDGGRLAVGRYERDTDAGTLEVWDSRTGEQLLRFRGHTDLISCLAFSPDGRRLASGSRDKTIIIWDVATGKELLTLRGHLRPVAAVAFSPDGTRLASGGQDQTLRTWDARPLADPND